jgi:hypothetical protein
MRAAMLNHRSLHPNLSSDGWKPENLPPRFTYAEGISYFVVIKEPYLNTYREANFRNRTITAADGVRVREFATSYEAARFAEQEIETLPNINCGLVPSYTVMCYTPDDCDLSGFEPPGPEIADTLPILGSDTVKDYLSEIGTTCGNCGRIGHNSRTCSKPTKAHDRLGIEIEGRWLNLREARQNAAGRGMTGCSDGSVTGSTHSFAAPYEFQTVPGTLAKSLEQLLALYPDEADASCGMHVHVSFDAATDVTLLCTPAFFDFFRARWTAWGDRMNIWGKENNRGEFWRRLNGGNDYCRVNTITPTNIQRMDRYHQLNFSAYSEHKTVECRLLPMFRTQSLAVAAVVELVEIIEDFLANANDIIGARMPAEEVAFPAPEWAPIFQDYVIEEALLMPFAPSIELDLPTVTPLAPASGTIRTFRGTVLAGATLAQILRAHNITIDEAA